MCETESFADKINHLTKFVKTIDGKWVYRLCSHTGFSFRAYNIIYQRCLLGQAYYYLKLKTGLQT